MYVYKQWDREVNKFFKLTKFLFIKQKQRQFLYQHTIYMKLREYI